MHRWMNCPGSIRLSKDLPPTTNVYADEGTKAHEAAADILNGLPRPDYNENEFVHAYVDLVNKETRNATIFTIEKHFKNPAFYLGFQGTADAAAYYSREKLLRVYDLKYGKGHFVKVEDNVQLLYYALGAALEFGKGLSIDEVEVVIVQPRMPRKGEIAHRWRFPYPWTLIDFALQFWRAAKNTEEQDAPLKEGAWCYFCPAVSFCPAQHQKRNDRAKLQFSEEFTEEECA